MEKLKDNELMRIKAGSSGWLTAGIIAGVTFLIGILDGISRPFRCR